MEDTLSLRNPNLLPVPRSRVDLLRAEMVELDQVSPLVFQLDAAPSLAAPRWIGIGIQTSVRNRRAHRILNFQESYLHRSEMMLDDTREWIRNAEHDPL
jgi:hypothetical protein